MDKICRGFLWSYPDIRTKEMLLGNWLPFKRRKVVQASLMEWNKVVMLSISGE
ncbi:hypothetical protein Fmac_032368 [Flemingia macrophylla]|uniref:Uncharacterized protein n=1 Tax=Flemingia macrophylla TaxID=520843 RepID=A0ABD1L4R8_9FABA